MELDDDTSNRSIGTALWVLLAGGVLSLGGLPFPVNGRYWDAGDDAERIAVIDADRAQFAAAYGFTALGMIVIGVGLATLALALAPAAPGRRRHTSAAVAAWLGGIGAVGGLVVLLHALVATPEFFVDSTSFDVAVIAGGIAMMIATIVVGVLSWSAPPPKWAAVVLIASGPLGFVPELQQIAVIVFAAASLVALARRPITSADVVDGSFVEHRR